MKSNLLKSEYLPVKFKGTPLEDKYSWIDRKNYHISQTGELFKIDERGNKTYIRPIFKNDVKYQYSFRDGVKSTSILILRLIQYFYFRNFTHRCKVVLKDEAKEFHVSNMKLLQSHEIIRKSSISVEDKLEKDFGIEMKHIFNMCKVVSRAKEPIHVYEVMKECFKHIDLQTYTFIKNMCSKHKSTEFLCKYLVEETVWFKTTNDLFKMLDKIVLVDPNLKPIQVYKEIIQMIQHGKLFNEIISIDRKYFMSNLMIYNRVVEAIENDEKFIRIANIKYFL